MSIMNNQRRRVVVTGMGAVTPIGLGIEEFWKNSLEGKSGAAHIASFDVSQYDTKIACELKGFDPLNYMDKKSTNRMDLFTQYAMACSEMALALAALAEGAETGAAGLQPKKTVSRVRNNRVCFMASCLGVKVRVGASYAPV